MYEDSEPRNRFPMFSMFAAIFFGAGSLWVGSQGLLLAFSPIRSTQTANALDTTGTFIQEAISTIQLTSTTTTVLVGGDIMLDRRIRFIGEKKGYDYLFTSLTPLFKTGDIVIANLEGPVTTNPSKTLLPSGITTNNMAFTFAPSTVKALSNAGITAVNLANNHEENFGAAGVAETKQWLKKSGVQWFGSPMNTASSSLVMNSKGMKIAFVGYHAFEPGIENVITDIKRLSADGDFVIVMPHWGPEYVTTPTVKMRDEAREFVAAGAKAVIGSHPHVIMSNETIAGVPVYYSVGNLIFDQYFSDDVLNGEIVSLKLVNGPAGPSLDSILIYGTKLDREKGVVLK